MVEKFRSDQRGLTLIELLVTILIVAILSSAATSMFLHQRRKGWMAQVVSATKSLASVQEYWFNTAGTGGYTPNLDDLVDHGFNYSADDVAPDVVAASSRSFCLEVTSRHDASIVWHYDSSVGRPDDGPINASCVDTVLVANAANAPASSNNSSPSSSDAAEPGEGSASRVDLSSDVSSTGGETGSSGSGSATEQATDRSTTSGGGSSGDSSSRKGSGGNGSKGSTTGSGASSDPCDPVDGTSEKGDGDAHPSGRDRSTESGGSGDQGGSESDPDGDANGGSDKPDGSGGADGSDQDGNNGSGNDSDFEDDNRGPDGSGGGSRTDGTCTTDAPDEGTLVIPW